LLAPKKRPDSDACIKRSAHAFALASVMAPAVGMSLRKDSIAGTQKSALPTSART
jgi:hypothetical protein